MLDALFQALRLDAQNCLRAGAQLLVIRRDERVGGKVPCQRGVAQRLTEQNGLQIRHGVVGRDAVALMCQPLHVDLGDRQRCVAERLVFGQNGPVFRDQMMAGEDHVLRRLCGRSAAVDIAADQPRRRGRDERAAVFGLADDLVRGGEIEDDGRAARAERG